MRGLIWAPLALFVLLSCCCSHVAAQEQAIDSSGTTFFVAMGPNHPSVQANARFKLTIAPKDTANVAITLPDGTINALSVPASSTASYVLPNSLVMKNYTETPTPTVVKVVSDSPIALYGSNFATQTSEAYLALPVTAWGTSYLVVDIDRFLEEPEYILLVASDNPTTITITTKVATSLGAPGTYHVTLQPLQAFMLFADVDVTGTRLDGSAPFGVIAGQRCANAPAGCIACDTVFEWLPPLASWGDTFLLAPFWLATPYPTVTCATDTKFKFAGDLVKVVAARNNTAFTLNGAPLVTLDAGNAHTFLLPASTSAVIKASGPAQVMQIMTGGGHRSNKGDPSMTLVPATDQWQNGYIFALDTIFDQGWANLLYVGSNPGGVELNGASVPASSWTSVPSLAGAHTAQVPLPLGTSAHTLRHADPAETVGVIIYGFSAFISWASAGGLAVRDVRPPEARCADKVATVGASCSPVAADINDGSQDPKGGSVTLVQAPPGPYPVGNTTVTLAVTDNGGRSSSCSAVVTVQDTSAPAALCPASMTVTTTSANTSVTYTATATDNCGANPTITCTPASGAAFPLGTTPVSCSAADAAGNTGACSFDVTAAELPIPTPTSVLVREFFKLTLPFTLLEGTARCPSRGRPDPREPDARVTFTPATSNIQCNPSRPNLDTRTCTVTVRCVARVPGSFTVAAALLGTSDTSDPGQELIVRPRTTGEGPGRD